MFHGFCRVNTEFVFNITKYGGPVLRGGDFNSTLLSGYLTLVWGK
jgi:hypothetical protein